MDILKELENQNVLIVGDVMLDRYLTGSVSRISPEAPVPVLLHEQTENRLGGAANVALNVQALGSHPILCSLVGQDEDGGLFLEKLAKHDLPQIGMTRSPSRRTTVKTRILGNNQQMMRIDREDTHYLDAKEEGLLMEKVLSVLNHESIQVIILQDYNKGVLTETIIRAIIGEATMRGIFTAADPKEFNFFAFEGISLFKPNLKEVRESAPFPISTEKESFQKASDYLRKKLGNRYTMLTLSEKGLFLDGGKGGKIYPASLRKVADVSGAGDTVISIAALALSKGLDLETVALLSNLAGGQVCESPGVVPLDRDFLAKEWAAANF